MRLFQITANEESGPKPSPMAINGLPPEILAEILLLATNFGLLGRKIHRPGYILRSRDVFAPLSFVHVCRYWRAVAFSIRNMWTAFYCNPFRQEALAHWTSLSGSLPLHLALCPRPNRNSRDGINPRTLKKSKERLRQISALADRWGSLCFDFRHCELTEALADMLQTTAPRSPLRRFELWMFHDYTPPAIMNKLISAIASFPSLRHFSWIFNSPESYLPRNFPWHALEDVYVEASIEVEDFIWCLMQCTSARVVTLLGKDWDNKRRITGAFEGVHCTLARLKLLTLNEFCDPYRFLKHFTLPSLVSLEIETLKGSSTALQDFLVRSRCPLRSFTLQHPYPMTEDEIIECLATPYLRSVPRVVAALMSDPKKYFAKLVTARPDILHDLPGIKAWTDETGDYIGWNRRY